MDETKTIKMFGTGQITLPKEWRQQFDTDTFKVKQKDNELVIKPVRKVEVEEVPEDLTAGKLREDLKEEGYSEGFIEDAVEGFEKSLE
ncbi:MAG: AbrB/MazE/SpoVT family DNA-binding domain-containing protein [Candidatus Paceibacteria bacterium]